MGQAGSHLEKDKKSQSDQNGPHQTDNEERPRIEWTSPKLEIYVIDIDCRISSSKLGYACISIVIEQIDTLLSKHS
jgi:hypothetical protein